MNNWNGVGRLTAEPEIRQANSGTSVASFTVACDRKFKREGQPTADFIRCKAFGKTAEFIEKYFRKGNRIGLTGSIQTGSYQNKDGQTVYTTDILVENVEFVESKNSSSGGNQQQEPKQNDDFMSVPDVMAELPFN